jgi:hypothetical protein
MASDNAVSTTTKAVVRPQDLVFTQEQLNKAFGKRLTHAEYLRSLRRTFNNGQSE